jgi:hypothetical protein
MTELKPCPFCGKDLSNIPTVMAVQRKYPKTYLDYLRSIGQFLGSDKDYCVRCIRCGAEGATKNTADRAIEAWNRRSDDV